MTDVRSSIVSPEPWLEAIEGNSPILLIAPHGGRAGHAARATMHPKVNDLHTAEITRELASRLGASALINSAMDRNLIDCNRIPQLAERAPWILELIVRLLSATIDRFGHATVLLIHGWNIIEPRIDFGLGARRHGRELRPVGAARISASDEFIKGPLAYMAERLRATGVTPSFGMRYPAGGIHNLVQAFTERHHESPIPALRRIAEIASVGVVNTAQLELSVAVRMPGELRSRCIDAIADTFSAARASDHESHDEISVVRTPRPAIRPTTAGPPGRVGVEFYDAEARIGGMASFDLGTPGFGARIMMIVGERRVILCTCEGTTKREPNRLSLGPLSLTLSDGAIALDFSGPAVVVPDGSHYLSIERALANGSLDPHVRIALRMPIAESGFDAKAIFDSSERETTSGLEPLFSVAVGEATLEGERYALRANARAGISFTSIGAARFRERRMIWALCDSEFPEAIELRRIDDDEGLAHHNARTLVDGAWSPLILHALEVDTESPETAPHRLEASASTQTGGSIEIVGSTAVFVPLSRPGPDGSRIYTSLGFGVFRWGDRSATGMFEYSSRVDAAVSDDSDSED